MSVTATTILNLAKNEVGYLEKKTNSQLDDKTANAGYNNYTKFARDLDKVGFFNYAKNGYAWCACFVCWLFYKATGSVSAAQSMLTIPAKSTAAGVHYFKQFFKAAGRLYASPNVGDVVFFGEDHTGVVIQVNKDGSFVTIEGNTSAGNNTVVANGGGVFQKSYSTVKSTYTFGRPKYDTVTTTSTTTTTTKTETRPTLRIGSTGTYVSLLQTDLIYLGYSCGKAGADGDFGNGTYTAVVAFQKSVFTSASDYDGIVGAKTWAALDAAVAKKRTVANATATTSYKAKVTATGGLNVRASASTNAKIVKSLAYNTVITIVATCNGWGKLSDNSGWVYLTYTKKV